MPHTPKTLCSPINLMKLSLTLPLELPWASVLKLPRSPTWRSESDGAPCCLPCGLSTTVCQPLFDHIFLPSRDLENQHDDVQWGPALVQPLVLSPNWWTCMPRSALGS
jgi:hypothetical protein